MTGSTVTVSGILTSSVTTSSISGSAVLNSISVTIVLWGCLDLRSYLIAAVGSLLSIPNTLL